jgi:hypothetical protein
MKRICAITMARNDSFFLERWIAYYGKQLGEENLYILLDGTDQQAPQNAGRSTIKHIEHIDCQVSVADKLRINELTKLATELLNTYDIVIGTDADEFLVVDPACNMQLADYLNSITIQTSVSGLGMDVGQHLNCEKALDKNRLFLDQRQFAFLSSRYTKAVVISKPVQWGSGFHRVRNHNFRIDKNLFLFHFGSVDYQMLVDKLSDSERIKNGWKRHLNKRTRTISIITNKKAYNADFSMHLARIIQTIIRPVFAWNKPSMGGLKMVVKIPERFLKSPVC